MPPRPIPIGSRHRLTSPNTTSEDAHAASTVDETRGPLGRQRPDQRTVRGPWQGERHPCGEKRRQDNERRPERVRADRRGDRHSPRDDDHRSRRTTHRDPDSSGAHGLREQFVRHLHNRFNGEQRGHRGRHVRQAPTDDRDRRVGCPESIPVSDGEGSHGSRRSRSTHRPPSLTDQSRVGVGFSRADTPEFGRFTD